MTHHTRRGLCVLLDTETWGPTAVSWLWLIRWSNEYCNGTQRKSKEDPNVIPDIDHKLHWLTQHQHAEQKSSAGRKLLHMPHTLITSNDFGKTHRAVSISVPTPVYTHWYTCVCSQSRPQGYPCWIFSLEISENLLISRLESPENLLLHTRFKHRIKQIWGKLVLKGKKKKNGRKWNSLAGGGEWKRQKIKRQKIYQNIACANKNRERLLEGAMRFWCPMFSLRYFSGVPPSPTTKPFPHRGHIQQPVVQRYVSPTCAS